VLKLRAASNESPFSTSGTARLATASPVEARKGRVLGAGGLRVEGAEAGQSFFVGVRRGLDEGRDRF
jgi:hypothetical protein